MTKKVPWFVEERAVAFASLLLTKHDDVKVQASALTDLAIDLRVEVLADGKSNPRVFGVQLVGYLDPPDDENPDERVLPRLDRQRRETEFPICVFVIGVRALKGVYRWAVEPAVEAGQARLIRATEGDWQPLDDEGVARLIGQVNAWYDALEGTPTKKPRGRHSRTGIR